jgi:hypothetical protein
MHKKIPMLFSPLGIPLVQGCVGWLLTLGLFRSKKLGIGAFD